MRSHEGAGGVKGWGGGFSHEVAGEPEADGGEAAVWEGVATVGGAVKLGGCLGSGWRGVSRSRDKNRAKRAVKRRDVPPLSRLRGRDSAKASRDSGAAQSREGAREGQPPPYFFNLKVTAL